MIFMLLVFKTTLFLLGHFFKKQSCFFSTFYLNLLKL
jgi:hypothetical protein